LQGKAAAAAAAAMGRLSAKSDYECLRDARISENMVRRKHLPQIRSPPEEEFLAAPLILGACAGPNGDARPAPLRGGAQQHRLLRLQQPRGRERDPPESEAPQAAGDEHDPAPPLHPPRRRDADWIPVDEPPLRPVERAVCSAQGAASQRSPAEFAALPWILAVLYVIGNDSNKFLLSSCRSFE